MRASSRRRVPIREHPPRRKRESGIALAIVLVVVLLLTVVATTFASRAVTDGLVSRNRNNAAQAEALARGGIRIATGVLYITRVRQAVLPPGNREEPEIATRRAAYATLSDGPTMTGDGGTLHIQIEDTGARLNLNSLLRPEEEPSEFAPESDEETFLIALLEKVMLDIDETGEVDTSRYDAREMARNLLDYMDPGDTAIGGRNEDDYYLQQDPPHRAPNRPLLSVGEIAMIEGFDARFARAMEPYVTVYPFVFARGVNVNSADPWILATLFVGDGGDKEFASEDQVRDLLEVRQGDGVLCDDPQSEVPGCQTLSSVLGLGEGSVFPPAALPSEGLVYRITSEATVGDVTKRVIAHLDVTNHENPLLLSWETR